VIPARISLVTLGVADVAKARAFYQALGFVAAEFDSPSVAFFQLNGTVLSLYGRAPLAEDAGVDGDGRGFRAVALAINVAEKAAVDGALAHAKACGGTIVKHAVDVFWGGYSGYFSDLDGHLWEIAYNPFWSIDTNGHSRLPPPAPPTPEGTQ